MKLLNSQARNWRKALDILVILPVIFFTSIPIFKTFLRGDNLQAAVWGIFFLSLALIIKSWLKPRSTQEIIDSLSQDEILLKKKISKKKATIKRLEELGTEELIKSRKKSVEADLNGIQLKLSKLQEAKEEYLKVADRNEDEPDKKTAP